MPYLPLPYLREWNGTAKRIKGMRDEKGDNGEWVERKNWKCKRMRRDKKRKAGEGMERVGGIG